MEEQEPIVLTKISSVLVSNLVEQLNRNFMGGFSLVSMGDETLDMKLLWFIPDVSTSPNMSQRLEDERINILFFIRGWIAGK